MRIFKYLIALFVITAITSSFGVFASTYRVASLRDIDIPGYNMGYDTPQFYLDVGLMGRHHIMYNVSMERELDIRVEKGSTNGSWKILKTGQNSQLTNDSSPVALWMQGGYFNLYIDSRWNYFDYTTIYNADWYLDSL